MSLSVWGRMLVVIVLALILQVAVVDQVTILGAHADLMVIIVGAAGLLGGPQRGATVGFVCGLFADLVVTTPFGLSPLAFVLVGYGVGLMRAIPQGRDARSAEIATCVVAAVVTTGAYAALAALAGRRGMLEVPSLVALLVVGIGALVLSYPVLGAVRWAFADTRPHSAFAVPSGGSAVG